MESLRGSTKKIRKYKFHVLITTVGLPLILSAVRAELNVYISILPNYGWRFMYVKRHFYMKYSWITNRCKYTVIKERSGT